MKLDGEALLPNISEDWVFIPLEQGNPVARTGRQVLQRFFTATLSYPVSAINKYGPFNIKFLAQTRTYVIVMSVGLFLDRLFKLKYNCSPQL